MTANALPQKLIVHCSHHKTGTTWFRLLLEDLARQFDLRYFEGKQSDLPDGTQLFVQINSQVDVPALGDFVGTHMIRDPRDVLVSAFRYHLHAQEAWLLEPRDEFGGKSYSESITSLERDDALEFEIRNNPTMGSLSGWNYQQPQFLELKYEEVITDPLTWFPRIFAHYGFGEAHLPKLMEVVHSHSFEARTGRKLGEVREGDHLRSGMPGQWAAEFRPQHRELFRELHGHKLITLGYEASETW